MGGNKLAPSDPIHRYYSVLTSVWHTDGSYRVVPSFASIEYKTPRRTHSIPGDAHEAPQLVGWKYPVVPLASLTFLPLGFQPSSSVANGAVTSTPALERLEDLTVGQI